MKKRRPFAVYIRYWGGPTVWLFAAGALGILLWEVARRYIWWL